MLWYDSHKPINLYECLFYSEIPWYRAVVLEVREGGSWTVQMIDWGSVDTVTAEHIRPFSQQFMSPPAQAVKCALQGKRKLETTYMLHLVVFIVILI